MHNDLARDPALRVLLEDGVEHRVADLVAHLVGMAFGDRLRRETCIAQSFRILGVEKVVHPIEDDPGEFDLRLEWQRFDSARGVEDDRAIGVDFESGVGLGDVVPDDEVEALRLELPRRVRDEVVRSRPRTRPAPDRVAWRARGRRRSRGWARARSRGRLRPSSSCGRAAPWAGNRPPRRPCTMTSMSAARERTASCISAAVCTLTISTVGGAGRPMVVTRVTAAPRRAATSAIAYPCFPDERLVMTRTASIGSRVPPAVTSTRTPAKSPVATSTFAAAATMASGAARRPSPASPPARRPLSGPTTWTPRRRRVAMLSCTAGCSHISVCMAGATSTGARVASSVAVSRSSEIPAAYLPSSFAVAGATTTRSAVCPRRVCGMGSGASKARCGPVPTRAPRT